MAQARPLAFVIGGFATLPVYYVPLKRQLEQRGIETHVLWPGPFGLNVWPMRVFWDYVLPELRAARECTVIGHSLGGLQAMWLADQMSHVRQVIAIGSPIHGLTWPAFELSVRKLIGADDAFLHHFRQHVVPRITPRLTTISSWADELAPTNFCAVDGARNHHYADLDHIFMPFHGDVIRLLEQELKGGGDKPAPREAA